MGVTFGPGHGRPCSSFSFLATSKARYQGDIIARWEPGVLNACLGETHRGPDLRVGWDALVCEYGDGGGVCCSGRC